MHHHATYTSFSNIKVLTSTPVRVTEHLIVDGALHVGWHHVPPFVLKAHHRFCASRALGAN